MYTIFNSNASNVVPKQAIVTLVELTSNDSWSFIYKGMWFGYYPSESFVETTADEIMAITAQEIQC